MCIYVYTNLIFFSHKFNTDNHHNITQVREHLGILTCMSYYSISSPPLSNMLSYTELIAIAFLKLLIKYVDDVADAIFTGTCR